MDDLYVQCTFKNENSTTTAWIEQKYAKVGLTGKFKDVSDDVRWEIVTIGETEKPKSAIDHMAEKFIYNQHPTNKMRGNK